MSAFTQHVQAYTYTFTLIKWKLDRFSEETDKRSSQHIERYESLHKICFTLYIRKIEEPMLD